MSYQRLKSCFCGMLTNLQSGLVWIKIPLDIDKPFPQQLSIFAWKDRRDSTADKHIKSHHLIKAGMLLITALEADNFGCLNLLLEESESSEFLILLLLIILHIPPNGSLVWSSPPWHLTGNLIHILAETKKPLGALCLMQSERKNPALGECLPRVLPKFAWGPMHPLPIVYLVLIQLGVKQSTPNRFKKSTRPG